VFEQAKRVHASERAATVVVTSSNYLDKTLAVKKLLLINLSINSKIGF
jgi:hypothetical protein